MDQISRNGELRPLRPREITMPSTSAKATAPNHAYVRGIACVMFSVLVWCGWMVFSSQGVRGTLTPYDLTALRFGTAGLVMLPVLIKKGFRLGPYGLYGIVLACCMGAPYNTIAIYGMKFAPVSHLGLINTSMLILTTLGGIFLVKEKTSALRIFGIVISVAGIACLLVANSAGEAYPHLQRGHAAFLIGGTMWAVYALLAKTWKVDALHATAAVCVYSALFYLPIYFLFIPSHIGPENMHTAIFQALYQGIMNSVFALLCYNRAIALIGATTSSAFLPLIPVFATLAAIPILNELPQPLEWLGIALGLVGVLLATGIVGRWLHQKEKAVA